MVRERPPRLRLLRWLRSSLSMAQPPLLHKEGNTLPNSQTAATASPRTGPKAPQCYNQPMQSKDDAGVTPQGMRDREPLFQTLFESSPDAIFIEDLAGNVLDCNPAAAALHGTTREKIIGRNVSDLVPPDRRTQLVTLSTEAAETPSEFEGWSLTDDGRSIPVSVRTSRIKYLGQPALLLNVRDITERKRFEEELRRTADELE